MPFWGVVRSLPQREKFAAERVEALGFPVFLPLVPLLAKRGGVNEGRPLWTGYFFAYIVDQWRAINHTFGVLCLVRTGDCPSRMPDVEIDRLKALIDGHGYVRLPDRPSTPARCKIAIGSKVKITGGPFGGMSGLYAGQSTRERELVLLNVLGGQRPVSIAAGLVVSQ
jgi:transcriptional antiterminator RfaH